MPSVNSECLHHYFVCVQHRLFGAEPSPSVRFWSAEAMLRWQLAAVRLKIENVGAACFAARRCGRDSASRRSWSRRDWPPHRQSWLTGEVRNHDRQALHRGP